jgi:tetratricopeptide (TPR) repeat protein
MRALMCAAIVMIAAQSASAQPASAKREAAAHFDRAQKAQAAGSCREAIAAYEAAHRLVPHPNTLYNRAVCYEALGELASAVEFYAQYLEAAPGANDADAVERKLTELRATLAPKPQPDPIPPPGTTITDIKTGVPRYFDPPRSKFHAGLLYGLAVADVPVQRFGVFVGRRFGGRLDLDGVLGALGKNDVGLGALARLKLVSAHRVVQVFARGGATIGYAKQDASSDAGTKFPLGLEAGGGVLLGAQGWLEVSAMVRATLGGWSATTTMVDSYVNDGLAFGLDFAIGFDVPLRLRRAALGSR